MCNNEPEDLLHAFFLFQQAVPVLTPEDILRLQLDSSLREDAELATVYTLATSFKVHLGKPDRGEAAEAAQDEG